MAPSPEQVKQKAFDSAMNAGTEDVAIFLKQQYRNLSLLYTDLAVPEDSEKGDNEYRRMAGELIKKRGFTAATKDGGTRTITLDELDERDNKENLGLKRAMREKFGEVSHIGEAVPTESQMQATAKAVADGVKENTGNIGFLGGATLGAAIKGFFSWMMSGFKGGFDGLKKTIANITAENMRDSVKKNLNDLRQNRSDMYHMLDNERIEGIGSAVHSSVLKEAGFEPPADASVAEEDKKTQNLRDVEFTTVDQNNLTDAREKIREKILYPDGGAPLKDRIANEMNANVDNDAGWRWGAEAVGWAPEREEVERTAGTIANTIATRISVITTNPAYRTKDGQALGDLSQQEFTAAVAQDVTDTLHNNSHLLGMHSAVKEKFDLPEARKETYERLVAEMAPRAGELQRASVLAKAVYDDSPIYAQARAAVDKDTHEMASRNGAEHVDDGERVASNARQGNGGIPKKERS
ncbi:MAG: hypothetical protein AB7F82_01615 [Alphaproteobacteria bacterium]